MACPLPQSSFVNRINRQSPLSLVPHPLYLSWRLEAGGGQGSQRDRVMVGPPFKVVDSRRKWPQPQRGDGIRARGYKGNHDRTPGPCVVGSRHALTLQHRAVAAKPGAYATRLTSAVGSSDWAAGYITPCGYAPAGLGCGVGGGAMPLPGGCEPFGLFVIKMSSTVRGC